MFFLSTSISKLIFHLTTMATFMARGAVPVEGGGQNRFGPKARGSRVVAFG